MNIAELEKIASQITPAEARRELERIKAEEAQQEAHTNAVIMAEKAKEQFNTEYAKLRSDKLRVDSELLQLLRRVETLALERETLENKLSEVFNLAENLARRMAQAGIPAPQPGQFLTIQDVAKQLILAGNNGAITKRANGGLVLSPFEVSPADSQIYLNLTAICSGDLRTFQVRQPTVLPLID